MKTSEVQNVDPSERNAQRNRYGVSMITQSGCGVPWPFLYLACSPEGRLLYQSLSCLADFLFFNSEITQIVGVTQLTSLSVCKGKSAPTALAPFLLVCHHGASSSCYTQYTQYLQWGTLGVHGSCFDPRSQVRREFLVTFCCGNCKIKIQLLKQIRGETVEGTFSNHTSHRQLCWWHS